MVVSNALATASVKLTNAGIAQPRREAASLLAFVLKKPNSFLIAHPEYELTDNETERFTDSVSRRAGREPFQYITGRQEFWGLDFEVATSERGILPRGSGPSLRVVMLAQGLPNTRTKIAPL